MKITYGIKLEQMEDIKKEIRKTEWYRQATYSKLLYIAAPSIGVHFELKFPAVYCFEKEYEGYYSLEGFNQEAKQWFESIKKNKEAINKYYTVFSMIIKKLNILLAEAEKSYIKHMKMEKIRESLIKINDLNLKMWSNCFLVDKFDPSGDVLLKEEIKKAKISLTLEEINLLVRPQTLNFIEQSNLELCRIALQAKRKKMLAKDIDREMRLFAKKYYFIQNSWGQAIFLTGKNFEEPFLEILQETEEKISQKVDKLEQLPQLLKKQCSELIRKHKIHLELENVFHLFRILGTTRDERKEIVLKTVHFNEFAARTIAKELNLDVKLLRNTLPSELAALSSFDDFKKMLPTLQQREQATVIYNDRSHKNILFFSGKEAKVIIDFLHQQLLEKYESLIGKVASKGSGGKIRGRVKLILGETHFTKFEEGDILVAPMTRPEYIPIMKKAKAIITDEGGITCHAAIVSRELGIPCIIGTQFATKKLFDQREIEINMETGEIKII